MTDTDNAILEKNELKNTQSSQAIAISTSYSGPIPSSSELNRYEKILPGAADRIITMAEKQSNHRHEIEKVTVETNSSLAHKNVLERKLGLWFGSNSRWVQRQLLPIYILRSAEPMLGMKGERCALLPLAIPTVYTHFGIIYSQNTDHKIFPALCP
jgi:uncharacterized membrane protein